MYIVVENDNVVHVPVIPILYTRDQELVHPIVSQFMPTDEFGHYVDNSEVCEYGVCFSGTCCICRASVCVGAN